jgi:hypothetical protein
MFTEQIDGLAPVGDMLPGDVMMVYRGTSTLGSHSNRDTKCATWRQVNDALMHAACAKKRSTLKCLTAGQRGDVQKLRREQKDALVLALIEDATNVWKTFVNKSRDVPAHNARDGEELLQYAVRLLTALDTALAVSVDGRTALKHVMNMLQEAVTLDHDRKDALPQYDWKAVPVLSNWDVDGILLSRDDDEYSASDYHAARADSSVVLNVAIQGHAAVRNQTEHAFEGGRKGALAQVFDDKPKVGDVLYLLLIASRQSGGEGDDDCLRFELKPSCRSVIDQHVRSTRKDSRNRGGNPVQDVAVPADGGLTLRELRHVCAAWKLGVVTDAALVVGKHRRLGVHVDTKPVTLAQLRSLFLAEGEPCPIGEVWVVV